MTEQPTKRMESDREIVVERTLQASPERIFEAYTDAKLVPRWWAPPGSSLRVEQMEVRPGGKYRYVQRTPGGQELVFVGSYIEVKPPTRLVYTFEVEGQGNPVTTTVDLHGEGRSTRVTLTNLCVSKEVREVMAKYGAEAGAKAALQQLAKLLEQLGEIEL
ncbi:MAG: SRPBCC domain-containing protein [Thermoplasmata archaeon]